MTEMQKSRMTEIFPYLPAYVADELKRLPAAEWENINEIRLRVNAPAVVMTRGNYKIIAKDRKLTINEISETFEKICGYSVYSHQSELARGFVTLPGGHRAGICGEAALDKSGRRTVRYISSVNLRVASEHIGCSREITAALFHDGLCGALIAGPPCSGKTTLLRDMARLLSSEPYGKKVAVVDERGEMAAMYRGEPRNRIGTFCDVLSGYPKGEGIGMAVRTLSPDIIVCDEIGGEGEAQAVSEGVNAGVAILASIHARDGEELKRKRAYQILSATGAFAKIVFLKGGDSRCEVDRVEEVFP